MNSDKQQGADFGSTTRDMIGRNTYEAPINIAPEGDLAGLIANMANILAGLAATLAVAAMIWGGIVWASSAGDEERIAKAKSIITWSIFGLILALSAWGIVIFVGNFVG